MCHFWVQNGPLVKNKIFLVQTITISFIYLLALFIVQNLEKLLQRIQNYEVCHFCPQNGPFFAPIFFWKVINIILIYLLAPFIGQNLKKNSPSGSRVMKMCNFWLQNGPLPQMRIFFQKTC